MRILVIEDAGILRKSLVTGLSDEGYVVDASADGSEGYWLAKEYPYDLIILDIMLPSMNGFALLEKLRGDGNESLVGIRRITTTPLYYNVENWRLDMPEISLYPASIYSTPWIFG